ncbi:MAG: hypothetical protein GOU99_02230 [Candidatus Altiarchaeota archaeon]|nr:hypothetical protein [Candidatus Altiarchaeota archaeon]
MHPGTIFAIVAAVSFGFWTVFQERASDFVNTLFGAVIVSTTAALLGIALLLPKLKSTQLYSSSKGIIFAVLAGVCALGIDFFALKAYGSGLEISVGGPIIIGGSVAIAASVGFLLGESFTLAKLFGLALVIIGSGILASFS